MRDGDARGARTGLGIDISQNLRESGAAGPGGEVRLPAITGCVEELLVVALGGPLDHIGEVDGVIGPRHVGMLGSGNLRQATSIGDDEGASRRHRLGCHQPEGLGKDRREDGQVHC